TLLVRRKRCLCPFAVSFGASGRSPRPVGSFKSSSSFDRQNVGGKSWLRSIKGFGSERKRTANIARTSRRNPTGSDQRAHPRNAGRRGPDIVCTEKGNAVRRGCARNRIDGAFVGERGSHYRRRDIAFENPATPQHYYHL